MIQEARYVHTNIIAHDWQALSRFYQQVFGCTPVPPERHLRGSELERGTGIPKSELHGMHLRLPGCGDDGPTLEIFSYTVQADEVPAAVNRPGFAHIAFSVPDVGQARKQVLDSGGRPIGARRADPRAGAGRRGSAAVSRQTA